MDQHVVAFYQLDVFSHCGEVEHFGAVLGFTLRLRDGQLARGPQLARGLQLLLRRHLQRVLGRVVRFRRLRHQQRQPSHTREQYFNEDLYKTMYSAMYTI